MPKREMKEKPTEDWCFVCKDGGFLRICDNKKCNKAYHPECVGQDDSLLESGKKWICNWHCCWGCTKTPKYYCLCCPLAVCKGCFDGAKFAIVTEEKGLCVECLELAWLIEEKKDLHSSGSKINFHEKDTVEFLFYEYYEIIKKNEKWTSTEIITTYDKMKKSNNEGSVKEESNDEVEDDSVNSESDYDSDKFQPRKKLKKPCPPKRPSKKSETKTKIVKREKSCFAAIILKNLRPVYLRRSFVEELAKQYETFEDKVVGGFVKIHPDLHDRQQKNTYMLVQVTGVRKDSDRNEEILLPVTYSTNEVPIRKLLDVDIKECECDDLRERVKNGLVPRQTVVDLDKKAKSLHEEMTNHWISRELELLPRRIDYANEKGYRGEVWAYLDRLQLLKKPEEQSRLLSYIPEVIAEETEVESTSSDD